MNAAEIHEHSYSPVTLNPSSKTLSKTHSNIHHEKLVHSTYRNLKVTKIQVQPKIITMALIMHDITEKKLCKDFPGSESKRPTI